MQNTRPAFDNAAFLDFLKQDGALPEPTLRRISLAALETQTSVERVILELGLMAEDALYRAVASYLQLPFIALDDIDDGLISGELLRSDFMKRAQVVPVSQDDDSYVIATANPQMEDLLDSVAFAIGYPVSAAITAPSTIASATALAAGDAPAEETAAVTSDVARLQALANDGPIITLVNDIIGKAVSLGASDVHIESLQHGARVRYRVDGLLQVDRQIPDAIRGAVASRLKIMAKLNISERRRPQDGRADIAVRGRQIDIRLSTLPTQHGESIVLRLLDRNRMHLDWSALRFSEERVAQIETLMQSPNGIFLVAGPTGSGKTTTLYTALSGINSEDRKIVTVEDPIEYALEGVNQVQVDTAVDMSFAQALRAILRQDPNIVMVGEIRDDETAEIAVRAALIGRLVLSTIHTNDAVSAVDRLLDLGVAPYLVGATLRGVLSQRLVRRNCAVCHGEGCDDCGGTGRQGRMAISEMLMMTDALSQAIAAGERGKTLERHARNQGFVPIAAHGRALMSEGQLSEEEYRRALGA